VIGPSFSAEQVPSVIAAILDQYVGLRQPEERFVETLTRVDWRRSRPPLTRSRAWAPAESERLEHA